MAGKVAMHLCDSGLSKSDDGTLVCAHPRPNVWCYTWLESMLVWEDFIPLLYKDLRVITLDLPGHGISMVEGEVHSMEFLADAVAGACVLRVLSAARWWGTQWAVMLLWPLLSAMQGC